MHYSIKELPKSFTVPLGGKKKKKAYTAVISFHMLTFILASQPSSN